METTLLKKLPFFWVFFCFMGFFQKISALQEKYSTFPSYSLLLQALPHKKPLKTNTSHYFELYLEISSEYLGQKIITFKRDFQWKKKKRKRVINWPWQAVRTGSDQTDGSWVLTFTPHLVVPVHWLVLLLHNNVAWWGNSGNALEDLFLGSVVG